jgi:hypothetical protein
VNQKRMKRISCSATNALMSSGVLGVSSAIGRTLDDGPGC